LSYIETSALNNVNITELFNKISNSMFNVKKDIYSKLKFRLNDSINTASFMLDDKISNVNSEKVKKNSMLCCL